MTFSLQARVVFPVDRPPIENGVVTIEGERIVAVATKSAGGDVIDLGEVALLPGFVNAHTHLEFSYLQRPLGKYGIPFVDWIRLVIAERAQGDHSPVNETKRGWLESLTSGVTTIGDITTGVITPGADVTHFHEVIAFSRARAESAMAALVDRIESHSAATGQVLQGISPHAPYTVSPRLVEDVVSYARKHSLPVAMHLAESREELELLRDGTGPFRTLLEERSMWDEGAIPRGSRALDYLKLLALAPRALVIHGNFLEDEELRFLATKREQMSLVYCPRTHAHFLPFTDTHYRLKCALSFGVRVALGTDSRASNPDLDLLAEMRCVTLEHPEAGPHQVLRMGTLAGAEALGRADDVGSITPGKFANLVAVPLAENAPGGPGEALGAILTNDVRPAKVWIRGREAG